MGRKILIEKGEVKGMDDLYRKSFLPLLGFFVGVAWLVTGFMIGICTSPEQIRFLGLTLVVIGLVLVIIGVCYFIEIADNETSKAHLRIRKLDKKG